MCSPAICRAFVSLSLSWRIFERGQPVSFLWTLRAFQSARCWPLQHCAPANFFKRVRLHFRSHPETALSRLHLLEYWQLRKFKKVYTLTRDGQCPDHCLYEISFALNTCGETAHERLSPGEPKKQMNASSTRKKPWVNDKEFVHTVIKPSICRNSCLYLFIRPHHSPTRSRVLRCQTFHFVSKSKC